MRSAAPTGKPGDGNEYWALRIFVYSKSVIRSSNGSLPASIVYKITPHDQISAGSPR